MSKVYLVPSVLDELALQTIPTYLIDAVKDCQVIFAENERTTRRFLKSICKDIVIDDFEWFTIHKAEEEQKTSFRQKINEGKNIAIILAKLDVLELLILDKYSLNLLSN